MMHDRGAGGTLEVIIQSFNKLIRGSYYVMDVALDVGCISDRSNKSLNHLMIFEIHDRDKSLTENLLSLNAFPFSPSNFIEE